MNKQNLILWIGSIVVVFVISYLNKITSAEYPVTGTIGIEGKKVSYRFQKIIYGNDDYTFEIRTDLDSLKGKYYYKSQSSDVWQTKPLISKDFLLVGTLPYQKPETSLDYYAELNYKDSSILIPDNKFVNITYFGKIPIVIDVLRFILMYGGLVLAVRAGLESFSQNNKTKKFSVMFLIIFLTLNALIDPLYLTYKYGFINKTIPVIGRLFDPAKLMIFILWIITTVILFKGSKFKYTALVSAVLTLMIFFFIS